MNKYSILMYHEIDGSIVSTKHEIYADSDEIAKKISNKLQKILGAIYYKLSRLVEIG